MAPFIALALALAIDPRATAIDVSGGVLFEARGGAAPLRRPFQPSLGGMMDPNAPEPQPPPVLLSFGPTKPSLLFIVMPNVDLQVASRRGGTFLIGYSPRVQYRTPNRIDLNRPILLHQGQFQYTVALTRRLSLTANANGSIGEVDYTGVTIVVGEEQAATPTTNLDILQFAAASGDLTIEAALAPGHRLLFGPVVQYREPIGATAREAQRQEEEGVGFGVLPTQIIVEGFLAYRHAPSRIDTIEIAARPGWVNYRCRTTYATADARLAWEHTIRPELDTRLEAGVFAAKLLYRYNQLNPNPLPGCPNPNDDEMMGDPPAPDPNALEDDDEQEPLVVFPVGSAAIDGRLHGTSDFTLNFSLSGGVSGYFDRMSQRALPRAGVTASLSANFPPRWSASISGSAYTSATRHPQRLRNSPPYDHDNDPETPNVYREIPESVLQLQAPITFTPLHLGRTRAARTLNTQTRYEFGGLFSIRASHLASKFFESTQLEAWFYMAVRLGGSTSRGGVELGERSSGQIGAGLGGGRVRSSSDY